MHEPLKRQYPSLEAASKPLVNPVSDATREAVRRYRLGRIRAQLAANDCAGMLLFDPVNIRYATDTSNMQVWTLHNAARYAMVLLDGPVIVFEFHGSMHLPLLSSIVDEVRPATLWFYFGAGSLAMVNAKKWADEVADLIREYGGGNRRLAIDKCDPLGADALRENGLTLVEGQRLCETARLIKSDEELTMLRWTMAVCESGMWRMAEACRAGMTEQQVWAELHHENIVNGGEWIETRLLTSGPRTNPWFQECNDRILQPGDILAFDTDLIGPYGYCSDISRTWIVDHGEPTETQAELHRVATEQIEHNRDILKPGMSYVEFNAKSWRIPERYHANRYSCALHGVGLCDEFPAVSTHPDFDDAYEGGFEENMVVTVESYIGEEGGAEGVKLEMQLLVTADGTEAMDTFPLGLNPYA